MQANQTCPLSGLPLEWPAKGRHPPVFFDRGFGERRRMGVMVRFPQGLRLILQTVVLQKQRMDVDESTFPLRRIKLRLRQ